MAFQFGASSSGQMEAVAALLQESFHAPSEALSLNRAYLSWKYYEAGPAWTGSRSYILSDGNEILAHAAIWPVELRLSSGVRCGLGFGDWAANPAHHGAGLLLLKKLVTLAPFVLVTGGAAITRQILPRMGFAHWADRQRYALVLRPIKQAWTRPDTIGWREPLRLLRNASWSLRSRPPMRDWEAKPGVPSEQALASVEGQVGSRYGLGFCEFLLRCPIVKFHFLVLHQAQAVRGYCILGIIRGQVRIADLRIASEDENDWTAAVAAVLHVVRAYPDACEVVAIGSVAKFDNALLANGFRSRGATPLVVFDSQRQMNDEPVPQLGMLEDDSSTVYDPASPYLT